MIKIKSLTFQYPGSNHPIFENINLEISPKSLTLVTGASGSGKSTLLRSINGLVPHFTGGFISGSIDVFGLDPIKDGPEKMAAEMGFVFQEPEAQFIYDTVEDEIAFALENAGVSFEVMHDKVADIIRELSLENIRHKHIQHISGGEKQLVAIASALVGGKKLLILDEPTSQLDPQTADNLLSLIGKMKDELGLTILISEHRLERLLPYTDNLLHLEEGKTPIYGLPVQVLSRIDLVPPIIEIAKKLKISPLPITIGDFPEIVSQKLDSQKIIGDDKGSRSKPSILTAENVSVKFDQQTVLKSINFQLQKGEILNIIGPNGAGKTTLLRSIVGLVPKFGQIFLNGEEIETMDLSQIVNQIAYLPQNPSDLLFAETVKEELQISLRNHRMQKSQEELTSYLAKFGLEDKKNAYPRDLSIGERQRVALAAMTIIEPKIILLDEPTRGLDYKAKSALNNLLKAWADQDIAIILITHDVEFAAAIADRVLILESGEIKFIGHPRIAFTKFRPYQTQTARLFPESGWISPDNLATNRSLEHN